MESTAQFRVAKHLQDLVQSHLPPHISEAHVQRYVQYCLRILSSRIQSFDSQKLGTTEADSEHIKTLIIKKGKWYTHWSAKFSSKFRHKEVVHFSSNFDSKNCTLSLKNHSLLKNTTLFCISFFNFLEKVSKKVLCKAQSWSQSSQQKLTTKPLTKQMPKLRNVTK